MNGVSLKETSRNSRRYIEITCGDNEIYEYQTKMINNNRELPLLSIDTISINNNNTLIYDITNCKILNKYINDKLLKEKEIYNILYTFVSTVKTLSSYLLNQNNLLVSNDEIYIDSRSKELKMIYIPLKQINSKTNIKQKILILDLLNELKSFGKRNIELDQIIIEVRDDLISTDELKCKLEEMEKNFIEVKDDNDDQKIKIKNQKTGFFKKMMSRKEKNEIEKEENDDGDIKPVQFGNEILTGSIAYNLEILDNGNTKTIHLVKDVYLIGRLEGAVDIAIKNSSIGRVHGRLEKQGLIYSYTDLNSKNGSYINGERLEPNVKYELFNGNQLKVASTNIYFKDSRGI